MWVEIFFFVIPFFLRVLLKQRHFNAQNKSNLWQKFFLFSSWFSSVRLLTVKTLSKCTEQGKCKTQNFFSPLHFTFNLYVFPSFGLSLFRSSNLQEWTFMLCLFVYFLRWLIKQQEADERRRESKHIVPVFFVYLVSE